MDSDSLHAAVEAHAEARSAGETALFASYMTPGAILQLRDERLPEGARATILHVSADGDAGETVVRFGRRVELRERWQRLAGLWKVTEAEVHAPRRRFPLRLLPRTHGGDG